MVRVGIDILLRDSIDGLVCAIASLAPLRLSGVVVRLRLVCDLGVLGLFRPRATRGCCILGCRHVCAR